MSKSLRDLETLRNDLNTMGGHLKTMAQTIATMSVFVQILIKRAGITNEELDHAIAEAAIDRAKAKLLQSQGAGPTVDHSGNGNASVPRSENGGTTTGSPSSGSQSAGVEEETPNEYRPAGNGNAQSGAPASS